MRKPSDRDGGATGRGPGLGDGLPSEAVASGLFDVLGQRDRRDLLARMTRRTYRRGDTVFHEGDPGDTFHVIVDGHVAVRTSTSLGDITTLTLLGPGDAFGEQALLHDASVRTASVVALDDVVTRVLQRTDFEELRDHHPSVERFLTDLLAAQVRRLSQRVLEALYVSADVRVVRRLDEAASLYPADDGRTTVPLRQDDVASMAGTTRPTANRVLRRLERDGVVTLGRSHVTVVDADELRRRAAR